jgi:hypothetical protein
LRGWLRYVKILRGEDEVVHICEPKAGRNLSDDKEKRSLKDLRNCPGGQGRARESRWARESR